MPKVFGNPIYEFYKPEGSTVFHAKINLQNKHKENFDTGQTNKALAVGAVNSHVKMLYKTVPGLEGPTAWKKRTGSDLSLWQIRLGLQNGTLVEPPKKRAPWGSKTRNGVSKGRQKTEEIEEVENEDYISEPGPQPIQTEQRWAHSQVRIENKFALAFQRIVSVCLLGVGADDAQVFREHVRAIVVETTLAGITPTGRLQRKRGRPPGS